jgi:hypothetical protein
MNTENSRLLIFHPKMKKVYIILSIVYTLLFILSYFARAVGIFDESFQLVGGLFVQNGSVPYRDFWAFYTPLNYYMNAIAFSVLGQSIISARIIQCVFYLAVASFLTYHLSQRIRASATIVASIGFMAIITIGNNFTHASWNAYALGFLGVLIYLQSIISPNRHKSLLILSSGFLIALSCFSKLNFGAYFACGVLADMVRQLILARGVTAGATTTLRGFLCDSVYFLLPFVFCSVVFLFSFRMCLSEAVYQTIVYPFAAMKEHRIRSFSSQSPRYLVAAVMPLVWLAFRSDLLLFSKPSRTSLVGFSAIFFLLLLFIGIGLYIPHQLPKLALTVPLATFVAGCFIKENHLDRTELIALLVYSFFLHYLFSRADESHFIPLLPLVTLLFPVVINQYHQSVGKKGNMPKVGIRMAVLILVVVIPWRLSYPNLIVSPSYSVPNPGGVLIGIRLLATHLDLMHKGDSEFLMATPTPLDASISSLYYDEDELKAARFVHDRTDSDEAVYIGLQDHSRAYANNIRTYWILGRRIGVKHYLLEQGLTTEDPIQEIMIQDIQDNNVNWIILMKNLAGDRDFQKRNYQGSSMKDLFIRDEFEIIHVFGRYSVLHRRGA